MRSHFADSRNMKDKVSVKMQIFFRLNTWFD